MSNNFFKDSLTKMETYSWSPMSLTSHSYIVCLLNQPIKLSITSFQKIWNNASFRLSVDGGTNHLFEIVKNNASTNLKSPEMITGDFDSILSHVRNHYEGLGTKIIETSDQNFTDFTKALMELLSGTEGREYPKGKSVLVINEPSGRHDQFFANISTLAKFKESQVPVFLMSEESISWWMKAGEHSIFLEKNYVAQRPYCGIIPMNGSTKFESIGLRWNLSKSMDCSFGENGIISTSNEITSDSVQLVADKDFLWTMKSFF